MTAPVAIVDIGSNSVRLVAYERLTRSPTPIFNEKVLCGLGKGVATSGLLGTEAMARALAALRGFRVLCRNLGVRDIHVLATAAMRDARNGLDFLAAAEAALGTGIDLIDGLREAELSALGILSGFHDPDGVVGDMGGGSLELIDVRHGVIGQGVSLPLGGLALLDASRGSAKRAQKIARDALAKAAPIKRLDGRSFYAVGGTWRALAKLHMKSRDYPLNVMQGYVIRPADALALGVLVERSASAESGVVAAARRPLLAYGAAVLEEIVRLGRPKDIVISAAGVREGMLFERLAPAEQRQDPLLAAAHDMNALRSRSPGHGPDLCGWTDRLWAEAGIAEPPEDVRLRHAACLMADVAWRSHPDYRTDEALNAIANGSFGGVDHAGRAFLALAVTYRHLPADIDVSAGLRVMLTPRHAERARLLGSAMRVAYLVSAAMADVLPRTGFRCTRSKLTLLLPADLADLASDRCLARLRQLGKMIGREAEVRVG